MQPDGPHAPKRIGVRAGVVVLALLVAWPPIHMWLAHLRGFSPWRYGGFGMAEAPMSLPAWVWIGLRSLSIGTWMAEIGLPLLALRPTFRRGAVLSLVGLEAMILVFTGEVHFGFTVIACLLSFFPREARWSYPISMVLLSAVAAALKLGASGR